MPVREKRSAEENEIAKCPLLFFTVKVKNYLLSNLKIDIFDNLNIILKKAL
jgi:hypothetical protein